MSIQKRIQAGIDLLDEYKPDWREHLWLDGLDMGSSSTGLLEQLYDSYTQGIHDLGLEPDDGYGYGFDIAYECSMEENKRQWRELTTVWREALSDPLAKKYQD